jgi:hypothetical protein
MWLSHRAASQETQKAPANKGFLQVVTEPRETAYTRHVTPTWVYLLNRTYFICNHLRQMHFVNSPSNSPIACPSNLAQKRSRTALVEPTSYRGLTTGQTHR